MTVYVDRDGGGAISGVYAREQRAGQESLPPDHPDVVAFLNPPDPPPPVTTAEILDAMKQIADAAGLSTAQKSKLTALIARLA